MATLAQRVHARNELNRMLHENIKHIVPQLENLVGKKIFLQDGSKAKAMKSVSMSDKKPKGLDGGYCNVHYSSIKRSGSILILELSLCSQESTTGCFYTKDSIVFGRVDGGELETVDSIKQIEHSYAMPKKKFTEAKVKALIEKAEQKEKEMRDLQHQVRDFI